MGHSRLKPAGEATIGDRTYCCPISGRALHDNKIEMPPEHIEQRSVAAITHHATIQRLLAETRFTIEREFCNYHLSPFDEGDVELLIEADK